MSTFLSLTDDELALLDGQCSEDAQKKVDAAKARIESRHALPGCEPEIAGFVADVVTEAKTKGKLIYHHARMKRCPVCGKSGGYHKYARRSKYHRKGAPNFSRPILMSGVELAARFVRVADSVTVGCCSSCWEKAKPLLAEQLRGVRAEIPSAITGEKPAFTYSPLCKCTACGWEGPEAHMRRLDALMDGTYPGGCPKCPANNLPLGRTIIESTDGFVLLENAAD